MQNLLIQIIESAWFGRVDMLGTIAFSISAVCIAYQKRITVFGTMVLALVPSMGGGLVRDLVFSQYPGSVLRAPKYILILSSTVLIFYFIFWMFKHFEAQFQIKFQILKKFSLHAKGQGQAKGPGQGQAKGQEQGQGVGLEQVIVVMDAFGLACFLVSGIAVSIFAQVNPLWLWGPFFAFITGAAGKMLRDLMVRTKTISSPEGGMFGEVAVLWGMFLSLTLLYGSNNPNPGMIKFMIVTTIFGAFFTRIFIYFFKVPNIHFHS